MYFDKPKKIFEISYDWGLKIPMILSTFLLITYFIYPGILRDIVSLIKTY